RSYPTPDSPDCLETEKVPDPGLLAAPFYRCFLLLISGKFTIIKLSSRLDKTLCLAAQFLFIASIKVLQPLYLIVFQINNKAWEFSVNDENGIGIVSVIT